MVIFFLMGMGDTRMGRDGKSEAGGHLRITHCQGTLPGLGSRSKGFAKCRLVATNVAHFPFIFFFVLFTREKRHYRPNSLSASTPPTSTCRILSQPRSDCRHRQRPLLLPLLLQAVATLTRDWYLYICKLWKMHTRAIDAGKPALERMWHSYLTVMSYTNVKM